MPALASLRLESVDYLEYDPLALGALTALTFLHLGRLLLDSRAEVAADVLRNSPVCLRSLELGVDPALPAEGQLRLWQVCECVYVCWGWGWGGWGALQQRGGCFWLCPPCALCREVHHVRCITFFSTTFHCHAHSIPQCLPPPQRLQCKVPRHVEVEVLASSS